MAAESAAGLGRACGLLRGVSGPRAEALSVAETCGGAGLTLAGRAGGTGTDDGGAVWALRAALGATSALPPDCWGVQPPHNANNNATKVTRPTVKPAILS